MVRLKIWQWIVLALPIAAILGFLTTAAGFQIHRWGINWIWAVVVLLFVGWRWLLVNWLRPPVLKQVETALVELKTETGQAEVPPAAGSNLAQQAEAEVQKVLLAAREDIPPWENWTLFSQRCQTLIAAIAKVYYPQVKRPLLNIYVPQAYGLLRDTVTDVERWMQQLSPALNQITIGQAYDAYKLYRKLEPATQTALKIWNWTQWLLNPAAALARTATQHYSATANQQLIVNLGQLLREQALQALGTRAIALYSRTAVNPLELSAPTLPQTQTLREIFNQTERNLEQEPVNLLLVGRTGAGKSSLINTLFKTEQAAVDVLPSTNQAQAYRLKTVVGESLTLWDTPGYEQIGRPELREQVLAQVKNVDALLLVTPATDPALKMDIDFLIAAQSVVNNLPMIAVITQVDRLRPVREWHPPYDWRQGSQPKERSIREALQYRQEVLGQYCQSILPLVTSDASQGRAAWGVSTLSEVLINAIAPSKQLRLARFLQDLETRTLAAAKVIDRYALQMSTTQGLASLLKSPVLSFISTLMTGSPQLAVLLAQKIPVEQAPVVMGKLQIAYELFSLLMPRANAGSRSFDLPVLWPLLLETSAPAAQDAWAFGHALAEYWTGGLNPEQLQSCYRHYLQRPLPLLQDRASAISLSW